MSRLNLTSDTADKNLLHPDYYLPSEVIESILVCLPIKDAVRTSILSSKWMHKWHSMSKLVFDSRCLQQSLTTEERAVELNKLANTIDVVLSLHVGPIQSFELSVGLPDSHDINHWILILWRNHIKKLKLELDFTFVKHCIASSQLLNCAELTHLELHNCQLTPSSCFSKLINLENLVLSEVGGPSSTLESLICSSPLLKFLSLDEIDGLTDVDIQGLNLEEISIDCAWCNVIICAVPRLTKLAIDLQFLFGGGIKLDRLPATHLCMKDFTVKVDFCQKEEVMTVLSLLKVFPNLKVLQIRAYNFSENEGVGEFGDESLTFNHLEVMTMSDLSGLLQELHLIKNILANAPVLKTLMLSIDRENEFACESDILRELLQYPRASSVAQILIKHFI